MQRELVGLALILATALCTGGCSLTAVQELPSILNNLIDDKVLIESFVHDLKKSYQPGDAQYDEARELYSQARAAYEGYINTVSYVAQSGNTSVKLDRVVKQVQDRALAFVQNGARALSAGTQKGPGPVLRGLAADQVVRLPDTLPSIVAKLPKQYRAAVVSELERQVKWRSWDSI